MAKQVGPVFFTGTIDGIIFYKIGDQYYSRSKGSYKSAKHMRRNPRYKRTMQQADQFGSASKLTQEVYYRHLPKEVRKHGLFGKLTGMVNGWLQEGKKREEVLHLLIAYCKTLAQTAASIKTPISKAPVAAVNQSTKPTQRPASPVHQKPRQARYLSGWKVKRNGRLHIPKRKILVQQHIPVASDYHFCQQQNE